MVETSIWISKVDIGLTVCRCTLEHWHCIQDRAHLRTLELMFGQMKHAVSSFSVALIPGCERECNESQMALQNLKGKHGRGVPVDTLHINVTSMVVAGTGLSDKEELP